VTFEEARALFPVLESVAYLNAGTFGPLARPVAEALEAGVERDLEHGRTGKTGFEETLALRDELRSAFAALAWRRPEAVALTTSTTDGCGIVLRGLGLTADDEIVTTTDEHFGLLGPVAASPARVVVVPPDPDRIAAAVTSRTRLIATSRVLWTTGAVLPLRELREQCGVPVLADGAPVRRRDSRRRRRHRLPHDLGQKWLCGPTPTAPSSSATATGSRIVSPGYFSQRVARSDGSFDPHPGARRFDSGWWSNGTVSAMLAALALRPDWWAERSASRCRDVPSAARAARRRRRGPSRPPRSSRFASRRRGIAPSSRASGSEESTCGRSRDAARSGSRAAGGRPTSDLERLAAGVDNVPGT
jgi:L-cysteine/cystine lyase